MIFFQDFQLWLAPFLCCTYLCLHMQSCCCGKNFWALLSCMTCLPLCSALLALPGSRRQLGRKSAFLCSNSSSRACLMIGNYPALNICISNAIVLLSSLCKRPLSFLALGCVEDVLNAWLPAQHQSSCNGYHWQKSNYRTCKYLLISLLQLLSARLIFPSAPVSIVTRNACPQKRRNFGLSKVH